MEDKRKELQCTMRGRRNELFFNINFKLNNSDFLEQIADKLESNGVRMEDIRELHIGLVKDKEVEEGK